MESHETSASFVEWMQLNGWWLGYFVTPAVGALLSHLMAWEKATDEWPLRAHAKKAFTATIKAYFLSGLIFWTGQWWSLNQPMCFIAIGVFSVFADDAIALFKRRVFGAAETVKGNQP